MKLLEVLTYGLRKGALDRGRVLLLTRFAVGTADPGGPLSTDDLVSAARDTLSESARLDTVAYAIACIAHRQGLSERELSASIGANRTTLRTRLRSPEIVQLSESIAKALASESRL